MSRNFGEGRIEDIRQGATKVCPPSAIYNLDAREMSRPYIGSRCQSIITSPPYYGLRDYGCFGQIGLEDSAGDYINNLVDIFTGLKNSLAEDGTLWVNLGDSYTGSGKGSCNYPENAKKYKQGTNKGMLGVSKLAKIGKQSGGLQRKNLMGIPWRFALAMQSAGWILRQDIIWYKPNCMPESCKDRFTSAYEHIFLFSRNPRYLFNPQSEPAVGFNNAAVAGSQGTFGPKQSRSRAKGNSKTFRGGGYYGSGYKDKDNGAEISRSSHGNSENLTGTRNMRNVWNIATRGFKGAHFATFPEELAEICVLAGSNEGQYILDPFMGSGTTGVVAMRHGRGFIGVDINREYCSLALDRIEKSLMEAQDG